MEEILKDLYPNLNDFSGENENIESNDVLHEEPNTEAKKFYQLLGDYRKLLYQGSKSSKLSVLVKLLHIKSLGHWSNESFTMLLKLLKEDLLPDGSTLPDSYYEAKKTIRDLSLSYEKIDACINDCLLFWKDDKEANFYKIYSASMWRANKHNAKAKIK